MSAKRPQPLLAVATSGRALARSACRGGWRVRVIDCFADSDTRQLADRCVRVALHHDCLDTQQVLAAVDDTPLDTAVVYGGGMEAQPDLIDRIAALRTVYGNNSEAVSTVGDPAKFFPLLRRLGVPHPNTVTSAPEDNSGQWLCKRKRGCGGGHVHWWRSGDASADCYYQRYVEGVPMSVLFLADGEHAQIVGFNRQFTAPIAGERAFRYGGAVSRPPVAPADIGVLEHAVAALTVALGLRGLNSLDFIAGSGGPEILELNARPSATFELYDADVRGGLLQWHIDAFRGLLPGPLAWRRSWARAHAIVYAEQDIEVPSALRWPGWITDRPCAGERIGAGSPICSVTAPGRDFHAASAALHARQARVAQWLDAFIIRPIACG